jgi:hypothetical protein
LYDETLRDARFPGALLRLDLELAEVTRAAGCEYCGGPVDAGHYLRKPRGWPWELTDEESRRFSFCCRRDGCRRRAMPPSVRFLGRRVYLGVIVLLAGVLEQGAPRWRVAKLQSELGADRRTLVRWRQWWTSAVARSRAFAVGRADFMRPPAGEGLPGSLVSCFAAVSSGDRLVAALSWLAAQFGARFPGDGVAPAEDAR